MKCTCVKEVFEYGVVTTERFTGKHANLPSLQTIYIEADAHTIFLTATNLEFACVISLPAKVIEKGKVSVPAKILSQFIQSIKEEVIELEVKHNSLSIKTPSQEGSIRGIPTEDFPLLPKIKKLFTISLPAADLTKALADVLPAVSMSEFKPELNGVFFQFGASELTLAATDTFRLAERKLKLSEKVSPERTCILPIKIAQELSRLFSREDTKIEFSLGEGQVEIAGNGVRIISRLVDGVFPEYAAIVPKSFGTSLFLPTKEFANAIRSSGIFSSKLQDVHLDFTSKKLSVTSENAEVGTLRSSFPTQLAGRPLSVHFNHRYLLDGMTGITEDEFFFGANDAGTPALIRNKENSSYAYVIMPVRVS